MGAPTTQLAVEYKGKQYSGIYSVAGSLMIVRIPGISSRSAQVSGDEEATARKLLLEILQQEEAIRAL